MELSRFGMDTVTLAGPLDARLAAARAAGFSQIMLWAGDLAGHAGGVQGALAQVRASGLRVTGLQVMRDYEGLEGALHDYKRGIAAGMLALCEAAGAPLLMVCSSTSPHAGGDMARIAHDLAGLAELAARRGVRIAYEALSWGRHVNRYPQSWEAVTRAGHPNLGIVLDSYHVLASGPGLNALDAIPAERIALVQLADWLWPDLKDTNDRMQTARHLRVFPGEGVHGSQLAELVRRLEGAGYRGDYSFEVMNDEYQQLPPDLIGARARHAAEWTIRQLC